MRRFIVGRFLSSLVALLGVSIVAFLLPRLAPGDPTLTLMSEDATEEMLEATREYWGLNRPLPVQYYVFVTNALRGHLGNSLISGRPTVSVVVNFLPNTAKLAGLAWVWAVVLGIPLGIFAALYRNKLPDVVISFFALIGRGVPHFWMGIMLILLFAVTWKLLPAFGVGEGTAQLKHLILPAFVLGSGVVSLIVRMVRSEMLEVLGQDYVRTARAKGLPERQVLSRHALKNALIPVVTVMGLEIGALMGGAIITETVFAFPGVGRLAVQAISGEDYPLIQALVLLSALVYITANFLVDIFYAYLDPQIRYG